MDQKREGAMIGIKSTGYHNRQNLLINFNPVLPTHDSIDYFIYTTLSLSTFYR